MEVREFMEDKQDIMDLIYNDHPEILKAFREKYPDVVIGDARDFIHEDRINVKLRDTYCGYYDFLVDNGISPISLNFQIFSRNTVDENAVLCNIAFAEYMQHHADLKESFIKLQNLFTGLYNRKFGGQKPIKETDPFNYPRDAKGKRIIKNLNHLGRKR